MKQKVKITHKNYQLYLETCCGQIPTVFEPVCPLLRRYVIQCQKCGVAVKAYTYKGARKKWNAYIANERTLYNLKPRCTCGAVNSQYTHASKDLKVWTVGCIKCNRKIVASSAKELVEKWNREYDEEVKRRRDKIFNPD